MTVEIAAPPVESETSAPAATTREGRGPLLSFLLLAAGRAVLCVLLVSLLTFVLASLVPGDSARSILGVNATPEQYAALRRELGLDQPLAQQYWDWLTGALHGDWGTSTVSGGSVGAELLVRGRVSLVLVVFAIVVAGVLGVGLGVVSAVRQGRLGRFVDVVSLIGAAVPSYWLGLVLAAVFAVYLRLLPATGYTPFGESPVEWFTGMILPGVTLGLTTMPLLAKQTRDSVSDELQKDYVHVLRARGLGERSVLLRHVLRNAASPILTVVGLMVVGLLSGTVLAETVFVLPGLGSWVVTATLAHDLPVVQAVAVCFTLGVVLVNLAIDAAYLALNPRARR
ncbi:MAG: ABC transporter permease [Aeromicrobium sp.]